MLHRLLLACCALWFATRAAEPELNLPDKEELTGQILDSGGEPVTNAVVTIESAYRRHGGNAQCPTCYPEVGKQARTDKDGQFKFAAVDTRLVYKMLVIAKGYEPKFVEKVDLTRGPANLSIWKRAPLNDNEKLVKGRIYSPSGKPVPGAVIEIEGAETDQYTTWGGHKQYIDPQTVTGEDGVFSLITRPKLKAGIGRIDARGYAQQWVRVTPNSDYLFVLHEGVSVTGQIMRDGKPIEGLRVAYCGADRSAGSFFQGWDIQTDAQGRFTFPNLPPTNTVVVYALGKSAALFGTFTTLKVPTGPEKSVKDLGKIELASPLHIKGRVVFDDGQPAFGGSKISFGREIAWDYQEVTLNDEGEFEVKGLAPEQISISIRMQGYKLSKKNPNREQSAGISGQLKESIENFLIIVEPSIDQNRNNEDYNWQVRETPLKSAKL